MNFDKLRPLNLFWTTVHQVWLFTYLFIFTYNPPGSRPREWVVERRALKRSQITKKKTVELTKYMRYPLLRPSLRLRDRWGCRINFVLNFFLFFSAFSHGFFFSRKRNRNTRLNNWMWFRFRFQAGRKPLNLCDA